MQYKSYQVKVLLENLNKHQFTFNLVFFHGSMKHHNNQQKKFLVSKNESFKDND